MCSSKRCDQKANEIDDLDDDEDSDDLEDEAEGITDDQIKILKIEEVRMKRSFPTCFRRSVMSSDIFNRTLT